MDSKELKTVAVIVAHPDDEILWTGGTLLSHPSWKVFVISLCRASDPDRSPKFFNELKKLGANGKMGDLDDGPEQKPLAEQEVEEAILELLPAKHYDLIISHSPSGEYTRHIRHEEIATAVIKLWHANKISAGELWSFAYEDGNKEYYPRPIESANIYRLLTKPVWLRKYSIITDHYGYDKESWEAQTTPKGESFWQFTNSEDAMHWLTNKKTS